MKHQKIIAIGGGDFRKNKTLLIDQEIVRLSDKKQPNMLFIPTASSDNTDYAHAIQHHFVQLGCIVDVLYLIKQKPTFAQIKDKILTADIIYVGGGNTLKMMNVWRRLGVDKLLGQAHAEGTVLCGLSAGSICWFNHGNSDSRKDKNPQADYIKVTALGFIDALHCPHYDTEADRKDSLKKMVKKYPGIAIALEDCAALQIVGSTYRILNASGTAKAYKMYYKDSKVHEEIIKESSDFLPLSALLQK